MSNFNLPQVPQRSFEHQRQQQLELMIQEYKKQTQNLEAENLFYKKQCQQLENQLNRFKSTVIVNDSNKESIQTINDPFLDVTALTMCEDIERYLEETNFKLVDENLIKPVFETLIEKLIQLVTFQYGSKDPQTLNRLKSQLIGKLNQIEQKIKLLKSNESRCAELERQYEKSNTELNAIKATLNCKQLVDSNEVDSLAIEFVKWKDEIKSINSKVNEQLNLVRTIVSKCEPIIDESKSRNNNTNTNNVSPSTSSSNQDKNSNAALNNYVNNIFVRPNVKDQNISPGNSPTQGFLRSNQEFDSFQMIDNQCNTIKTNNSTNNGNTNFVEDNNRDNDDDDDERGTMIPRGTNNDNRKTINAAINNDNRNADATLYRTYNNEHDDDLWQCPICSIQVGKDTVKFDDYYEHASKCSGDQLTCMFCLKLFPKAKEDEYYKHVQQEHGE